MLRPQRHLSTTNTKDNEKIYSHETAAAEPASKPAAAAAAAASKLRQHSLPVRYDVIVLINGVHELARHDL